MGQAEGGLVSEVRYGMWYGGVRRRKCSKTKDKLSVMDGWRRWMDGGWHMNQSINPWRLLLLLLAAAGRGISKVGLCGAGSTSDSAR
jgi:hypothetical protein